ncbi:MAG: alpha/beta hydrolase [Acidimicrobiia bacterium]
MSDHPVMPGAEPVSYHGSASGVLVLHGFTGSPSSIRPIAEHLVAAGYSVEAPLLPGHGTHVSDMLATGWDDWTAAAADALDRLAERTERRVVVGLSMGGSLTLWLAARQCADRNDASPIDGVVCINPKVVAEPDEIREMAQGMVDEGDVLIPGSGNDIAKEGVTDLSYSGTPLPPALSLWEGLDALGPGLARCDLPMLLMTSPQDHVVPPSDSDHLAQVWAGPVRRRSLDNSFHVATLDHDAEVVLAETLAFVHELLGPAR